jgi:tRNA threonylcarbamoyladenosine biosynthesis protein TsaB
MSGDRILAIDAATYTGSVALLEADRVVIETEVGMRGEHEERLMPAIAEVLKSAGLRPHELSAVAVGAGPGSFTSLRIAAALAKGLAVSAGIPLYAASSLTLMVAADASLGAGDYQAQLDAMRGDVYVQRVRITETGDIVELTAPALRSAGEARELAERDGVMRLGTGDGSRPSAPHARGFRRLMKSIAALVSVSGWEPLYGRLAEAQVKWEQLHGRALSATPLR